MELSFHAFVLVLLSLNMASHFVLSREEIIHKAETVPHKDLHRHSTPTFSQEKPLLKWGPCLLMPTIMSSKILRLRTLPRRLGMDPHLAEVGDPPNGPEALLIIPGALKTLPKWLVDLTTYQGTSTGINPTLTSMQILALLSTCTPEMIGCLLVGNWKSTSFEMSELFHVD